MSETREAPRGLDTLSAEDMALMRSMQDDGGADEPLPSGTEPPEAPDSSVEIEIPGEPEPAIAAVERPARRSTMVPQAAMHEEREKRKEIEAKWKAEEAARIELEKTLATEKAVTQERLNILTALATEPRNAPAPVAAPVEEPLPDVNTDPIGHFRAANEQLKKQIDTLTGITRGQQEAQDQSRRIQEMRDWGTRQELAFEESEPAYRAAMAFLRKNRDEELFEAGWTDPAQRAQIMNQEVTQIADKARSENKNFAERLYNMAAKRGFQKTPPPAPVAVTPTAPAAPVIPPLDPDLHVPTPADRAEAGRANAATIGSIGSAPPARLTVERILALPDDQFQIVVARMKAAGTINELMGS